MDTEIRAYVYPCAELLNRHVSWWDWWVTFILQCPFLAVSRDELGLSPAVSDCLLRDLHPTGSHRVQRMQRFETLGHHVGRQVVLKILGLLSGFLSLQSEVFL